MYNANNFISSVQTSGIRIRITGYSFRKAMETEKNIYIYMLESFLNQWKKTSYVFCVNHPFQAIWSRFFKSCSESFLWTVKKNLFLYRPDPDPQKKRIQNTAYNSLGHNDRIHVAKKDKGLSSALKAKSNFLSLAHTRRVPPKSPSAEISI